MLRTVADGRGRRDPARHALGGARSADARSTSAHSSRWGSRRSSRSSSGRAASRPHAPRAALARHPLDLPRHRAVVVLIGLMVIPPLVAQARGALGASSRPSSTGSRRSSSIQADDAPRDARGSGAERADRTGGNAVGTVLVAISSLIGGIFGLITILILSFYLLIEAGAMFDYLVRFVAGGTPRRRRPSAARQAVAKVSAWLRAQFMLAGVMGTFAAVGLGLMGVPYFYVDRAGRGGRRDDPDRRAGHRRRDRRRGRDHRLAEAGADGGRLLPRPASARGEHPGAEDHGDAASASARWR